MFKYILRSRPAGIGCQPMDGLITIIDKDRLIDGYYAILIYSRKLTDEEIKKYELKEA